MKNFNLILFAFVISAISVTSYAGKIYRFTDNEGISTLSKSLPPYAAQQGYDILDEKSLRLIRRVYTRKELNRIQKEQRIVEQKENKIRQRQQEEKQRRLEQRVNDESLLARYPTKTVFIKSRDDDLQYHQRQIDELKTSLADNKARLNSLQQTAAEVEINGEMVSTDLHKQLLRTEQEIQHKEKLIDQAISEKIKLSKQYKADLIHLSKLLHIIKKPLN